jgi:hypothetical protein
VFSLPCYTSFYSILISSKLVGLPSQTLSVGGNIILHPSDYVLLIKSIAIEANGSFLAADHLVFIIKDFIYNRHNIICIFMNYVAIVLYHIILSINFFQCVRLLFFIDDAIGTATNFILMML